MTPRGSVQQTINVSTQVSPGTLTINTNNASSTFTFMGTNSITTGGAVAVNGPGTVLVTNNNNLTGT